MRISPLIALLPLQFLLTSGLGCSGPGTRTWSTENPRCAHQDTPPTGRSIPFERKEVPAGCRWTDWGGTWVLGIGSEQDYRTFLVCDSDAGPPPSNISWATHLLTVVYAQGAARTEVPWVARVDGGVTYRVEGEKTCPHDDADVEAPPWFMIVETHEFPLQGERCIRNTCCTGNHILAECR